MLVNVFSLEVCMSKSTYRIPVIKLLLTPPPHTLQPAYTTITSCCLPLSSPTIRTLLPRMNPMNRWKIPPLSPAEVVEAAELPLLRE
ncbi:uncharacterized protein QC761_0021630 [Podospora bellae-mahoneyi]|uniref:Uncharacterized protein n=1 Tax=Podospora bellae-mahoneyi TaxID=2093777 RepID=A0ABR0G163_9PEZI|nr:hypothetical protein QC761_0021630 [Podospora bellae-mahoneyi]